MLDLDIVFAQLTLCNLLLCQPTDQALFVHIRHSPPTETRVDKDVHLVL